MFYLQKLFFKIIVYKTQVILHKAFDRDVIEPDKFPFVIESHLLRGYINIIVFVGFLHVGFVLKNVLIILFVIFPAHRRIVFFAVIDQTGLSLIHINPIVMEFNNSLRIITEKIVG